MDIWSFFLSFLFPSTIHFFCLRESQQVHWLVSLYYAFYFILSLMRCDIDCEDHLFFSYIVIPSGPAKPMLFIIRMRNHFYDYKLCLLCAPIIYYAVNKAMCILDCSCLTNSVLPSLGGRSWPWLCDVLWILSLFAVVFDYCGCRCLTFAKKASDELYWTKPLVRVVAGWGLLNGFMQRKKLAARGCRERWKPMLL
jgi:hypothetical protein